MPEPPFPDYDLRGDRAEESGGDGPELSDRTSTLLEEDLEPPDEGGRSVPDVDFVAEAITTIEDQRRSLERDLGGGAPLAWSPGRVLVTSAGERVVDLDQQIGGVPVFGMRRTVVFNDRAYARRIVGDHLPPPPELDVATTHRPAEHAVEIAARWLAERGVLSSEAAPTVAAPRDRSGEDGAEVVRVESPVFSGPVTAELVVFPLSPGQATLAWQLDLAVPRPGRDDGTGEADHGLVVVDALRDGEVLFAQPLAVAIAARGKVFPPSAAPSDDNRVMTDFQLDRVSLGLAPPATPLVDWCLDASTVGAAVVAAHVTGPGTTAPLQVTPANPVVFAPTAWNGWEQKVVSGFYAVNLVRDVFACLGHALPVTTTVTVDASATDGDAKWNQIRLGPTAPFDFAVVAHEVGHLLFGNLVTIVYSVYTRALDEGYADFWGITIREAVANHVLPLAIGQYAQNGVDVGLRDYDVHVGSYQPSGVNSNTTHAVGMTWCASLLEILAGWTGVLHDRAVARHLLWDVVLDTMRTGTKVRPDIPRSRATFAAALQVRCGAQANYPALVDVTTKAFVDHGL